MFSVFSFHRLHENELRFKPSVSAFEFQHLLYNLTALRISNAGGHNCKFVCMQRLYILTNGCNTISLGSIWLVILRVPFF